MTLDDHAHAAPRPPWVERVAPAVAGASEDFFTVHRPPGRGHRASAVLVLVGPTEDGESVVLIERAGGLSSHAGQIAFPGGRVDPSDAGPVEAALREAHEEIGLDPCGVEVVTTLPELHIPVSDSVVSPVLAWWARPAAIRVASVTEVARILQVPLARLADPAHRITVTHDNGYRGLGFEVDDLFVWGFTAGVLDRLLVLAGLSRDWDADVTRPLPERVSGGRAPMLPDGPGDGRRRPSARGRAAPHR